MAKQETTLAPQQPVNLLDQLTTILTHPEFESFANAHLATPIQQERKLSPEDQKVIDAFLEQYHQNQKDELMKPGPTPKSKSIPDMMLEDVKNYAPKVGGVLNTLFGNPFTHTNAIPDSMLHAQQGTSKQDYPELPEESGDVGQTEVAKQDDEAPQALPDQGQDYQKLIDELSQGASQLNNNIDVANDAADETQKQIFNAYNKVVPIEPITPLRVLGDLVKIGAAFANQKNPGLALALLGAGDAIKGYDPAYRDYVARKSFANALFEGMSATSLKALDTKLKEPSEKRTLGTQVKLAAIQEKGQNVRQQYHETSENVRARQAGERQLETMGLKVGRQSLLDQIAGLTDDAGLVKIELERLNDEGQYDDLTQREKVSIALKNIIQRHHPKENFNSIAVRRAGDDLYKMLSREIKK